jgi:cytoskeletal protein CcmA (bactofilin family)
MSTATSVIDFPQGEGERLSNLGPRVRIQGKVFSDQDLQVDGEIEGTVEVHGHNLTIGPRARLRADIKAQNISVVGTVEGTIEASERIELCSQCRVVGKIRTRRIAIKDGAFFKGNVEVVQARAVAPIRPAAEAAPAARPPALAPQASDSIPSPSGNNAFTHGVQH